ncbi:hypothetical protein Tco_0637857 [Tanacetum coccineum]
MIQPGTGGSTQVNPKLEIEALGMIGDDMIMGIMPNSRSELNTGKLSHSIMGEPLSPDRVFDFLMDEPHPAYDFFAPAPLPEYAGNPNNNNGWLAADDYLLGELEAMVDEQMVVPAVDEIAEQMVVPSIEEMGAPMMDMEEDLAVLFGDDDFDDDASDGFGEEEV